MIPPKKPVLGENIPVRIPLSPKIYFKRELNTNISFTELNISFTEQMSLLLNLHLEGKMVLSTKYLFY